MRFSFSSFLQFWLLSPTCALPAYHQHCLSISLNLSQIQSIIHIRTLHLRRMCHLSNLLHPHRGFHQLPAPNKWRTKINNNILKLFNRLPLQAFDQKALKMSRYRSIFSISQVIKVLEKVPLMKKMQNMNLLQRIASSLPLMNIELQITRKKLYAKKDIQQKHSAPSIRWGCIRAFICFLCAENKQISMSSVGKVLHHHAILIIFRKSSSRKRLFDV